MANEALAREQLNRSAGLTLLQEAYELKRQGEALGAIEKFRKAEQSETELGIEVEAEIEDVRRQVATQLAQEGEALAKAGDFEAAEAKFQAALDLKPPPDTPVYVYVPAGEFDMGPDPYGGDSDVKPADTILLDAFWIQRTEVTNAQYLRCVEAGGCESPDDGNIRYRDPQFANQPVSGVTWFQAGDYAGWVGGRLPTEAEWEKACRGSEGQTYPWGNQGPTGDLLNFADTGLGTWSAVGSYPDGASPYGALDMAGNVLEWTSSQNKDYPYDANDGRENLTDYQHLRVLRGGSFGSETSSVRCAVRLGNLPESRLDYYGFRVGFAPPSSSGL